MDRIGVRWGATGDEGRVAELMESNGVPRVLAYGERFVIAEEKGGKTLALLGYETVAGRLLLGPLIVDPWAEEHGALATVLYNGAARLAREAGIAEVDARSISYGGYYHSDGAGYRWWEGDRRVATALPFEARGELPAGGWRRVFALLGFSAVPFFRAFRP